ncbi:hypothetical protein CEXT_65441 [Caerostris extrusa]|uniref:Uncharacterized protein n=1 Tax=Caerostris extrusa TaxID=172846 RepID=A0AAV4V4T8_CAEEX|nr:hypothetical protein CEXT_65441 [Caerostris extrusa]
MKTYRTTLENKQKKPSLIFKILKKVQKDQLYRQTIRSVSKIAELILGHTTRGKVKSGSMENANLPQSRKMFHSNEHCNEMKDNYLHVCCTHTCSSVTEDISGPSYEGDGRELEPNFAGTRVKKNRCICETLPSNRKLERIRIAKPKFQ